ncbi:type IIL restriction-modification enzyme MmeI [Bacillus coahuilensis]|uniref:type IIL restriction-modification enzyme MmeI n=1 Tax=Bacillus coahuilensis TaxID=408580 RepID=UPI003B836D5F
MPNDGGHLLMTREEYPEFLLENPGAEKYLRKFVGSDESGPASAATGKGLVPPPVIDT